MRNKLTTEDFIRKAILKHGDKYNYDKVEYVNAKTPVIIICPIHGEFKLTPDSHLQGSGCMKCSILKTAKDQSLDTKTFIERAKSVHGDRYDYSKTEYVNAKTKVIITCKVHGDFKMLPSVHLRSGKCLKCARLEAASKKRRTTEWFINEAKKIHGDKYDYSKTIYKTCKDFVTIICPIHGEFLLVAEVHLRGNGCKKCANDLISNKRFFTQEDVILLAKKVHGDKYDYTKVEYKGIDTPVCIICPEHGEFWLTPYNHIHNKSNCPMCSRIKQADSQRYTTDIFIDKARAVHGDKYDYSKVVYIDSKTPVTIICPIHGEFQQAPNKHLYGYGCNLCGNISSSNKLRHSTEDFIKIAKQTHGDTYDYSLVEYVNTKTKVKIICPEHGVFELEASSHLLGAGCPKCLHKSLLLLYNKLKEAFPNIQILYEATKRVVPWINTLRFDIYFPEYNIAVEYDGRQHFMPVDSYGGVKTFEYTKQKDAQKDLLCLENGCSLFRVKYTYTKKEFKDLISNINNIIKSKDEESNRN